ncbi:MULTISPECIES: sugar phosphate isomerase/epimerase [unclassified Aureimonas]|uniref:sugar phosphate isomerase/epimerase family protein n=1 Tax=unclassified Aureimonas TaxID=2615206 RepID=UPI000720C4AD|nr:MULTISPECIES: sugar phosphate isomerase/epimerase [unclassified Aureimonas]ALN75398.1 hypothetical protein M673_21915 [Aureimonas sp. AU20]
MTTFSMQLYSARNAPPLADRLRDLAALGYTDVECFRGLYDDVPALKAALDANGLSARSGHFSVELLESDFARCMEIARTLGNEIVVLPYLLPDARPSDAAGWQAFGERVATIARRVKAEGLRAAWHNHDFEMREVEGGGRPLSYILDADPAIEWEADLAWVVRGEEDPAAWLQRYSGRVASLHVKDIAPAGTKTDEDGWADVGEGVLDWEALWKAGKAAGADLMIAEHDNPSDFTRFARTSLAAFRRFEERS